jgi:hypothetical protein
MLQVALLDSGDRPGGKEAEKLRRLERGTIGKP